MPLAVMNKVLIMINYFEVIIEDLQEIKSKFLQTSTGVAIQQKEIIDRRELCKRLAITEPTAIRWEKKNKIPCFRIGSSVRYNWHTVIETLEKKGGSK